MSFSVERIIMATVLVIEDEMNIRLFVSANLEARGYTVLEADTGEDGLRLLRDQSPNAVILDMLLPDMTGWDVLDRMAAEDALKAIPVILMTASLNVEESANYPNLVQHVMKPASVNVLLDALRSVTQQI
jgi:CheY-like chemotaxis protein